MIDAFWTAVDDLSAKFLALGEYFVGPADSTDIFVTATTTATAIVHGVTEAFSFLLGMTASVIEGLGIFTDGLATAWGVITGTGVANDVVKSELDREVQAGRGEGEYAKSLREQMPADTGPSFGDKARETAASIRAGRLRFDLAQATRPDVSRPDVGMYGNVALGPQKPNSLRGTPKPPKVNVKVVNHNHWNVRDVDPNAIVAAHNKNTARSVAVPLTSALAMGRRR